MSSFSSSVLESYINPIYPRSDERCQYYIESIIEYLITQSGVFSYEALADAECYDEEKRNHRSVRYSSLFLLQI